MIRLYFNKHGERPWSVDEGEGTQEHVFKHVAVRAMGCTVYTAPKGGVLLDDSPCAWMEFLDARLGIGECGAEGGALIYDRIMPAAVGSHPPCEKQLTEAQNDSSL